MNLATPPDDHIVKRSMLQARAAVSRFLAFAMCVAAVAAAATAWGAPWPVVDSDLKPPPEYQEGTLPNGVRYVVLPNAEPKGQVSLRLLVAAGSLIESDDEHGMAHFVEHMAFRSTRSHPNSSLIPALERLGLGFGPDTAAFTSYDHTIYHLELPNATEQTIRDGVRIFREFATEVTFDPQLIENERGVVLAEAKVRDTPNARQELGNLAFLWPGARYVRCPPIGNADAILSFTRQQLVAFYNAWYRPERMVVIAVGDVDPALVRRIFGEEFGSWTARGAARPEPADQVPTHARGPDVRVFSDPGLPGCSFLFEHANPEARGPDTHARRVQELYLSLAHSMLQRRLLRLAMDPKTTFVAPQVGYYDEMPGWRVVHLSASGRFDDWGKVAADLEKEHRRAFLYGFTPTELAAARAAMNEQFDEAVRTVKTWSSDWLATQIATDILEGRVFVRPADAQRDLAPALAQVKPADCLRAFRAAWTPQAPDVYVAANEQFHVAAKQIGAALNLSRTVPVARFVDRPVEPFAYTSFGSPGKLVRDEHLPDLDVRLAQFANGVRCNFKATTFESDIVQVHVRVGGGKLVQPADQPGLDLLAGQVLIAGGLGRHTVDAISDLTAVTTVRPEFHVESDACVFTARCSRRDLKFCLQLLTAYLTDAAYRSVALRAAQASFGSMYASLAASPGGPIALDAPRALAGGDRRFGTPKPNELGARTVGEVKEWLEPQFKHGAIEISVVGDTSWPEVEPDIAATFGALPPRADRPTYAAAGRVRTPAPPVAPQVLGVSADLKQCAVAWYWPVRSVSDVRQERRYYLLAGILADRLRVRLRDELGATYTPTAEFERFDGFPALNWISCYAEVDPTKVMNAMQIIERSAMELSFHGPSAEEFQRARQVFVRQMTDDLRTNAYWGSTVLSDAQERPQRLAAARNRAADLAAIKQDEVAKLTSCFDASNSFRFITTPYSTLPGAMSGLIPSTPAIALPATRQ